MSFEIATWYDTWNSTGLDNLAQRKVPLGYASRYNLAFGEFVPCANGYTVDLNAQFASQVLTQIRTQAPGVLIYAGVGDTGLSATVLDNRRNNNRSTANIVAYLQQQGLNGIAIDSEQDGMTSVPELVSQLGPAFKQAGLGIAVSVPWPGNGPVGLYGDNAVAAFNQHVDAVELQDYSSKGPRGYPGLDPCRGPARHSDGRCLHRKRQCADVARGHRRLDHVCTAKPSAGHVQLAAGQRPWPAWHAGGCRSDFHGCANDLRNGPELRQRRRSEQRRA